MDCVIDYESYQSLKQNYEQLLDCNRVLETENETLMASNKILKRLMIAMENIKTSLEQKVLIIQSNSNVKYCEELIPFDRELLRLDEEYCQLKCELNRLEFDEKAIPGDDYSSATRLVDQLSGGEIDQNCVQYVVHQLLPTDAIIDRSDGQTNEDPIIDFLTLSANTHNSSSASEEPTPKRGRTKKPKGFLTQTSRYFRPFFPIFCFSQTLNSIIN